MIGFDVETHQGNVKLLACSDGTFVESSETDRLLDFLYDHASRPEVSFSVFFNVGFDLACILKPWVVSHLAILRSGHYQKHSLRRRISELEDKAYRQELSFEEKAELTDLRDNFDAIETIEKFDTDRYRVTYVMEKGFSIHPIRNGRSIPKRRTAYFFDAANFYSSIDFGFMSLDAASKRYLGDQKSADELGIDRAKIGTVAGYYEEHRERIIRYCVKDCDLTARLFALTIESYSRIGIPFPRKPFSKASIHKNYLKVNHIVDRSNERYAELELSSYSTFWRGAYHGGIFLTRGVGRFEGVYDIDLVSAYPCKMADLPSVENAQIVSLGDPAFDSCYYKFWKLRLHLTPRVQVKTDTKIFYGYTDFPVTVYCTDYDKRILDLYGDEYTVVDGVGLQVDESNKPFRYINEFFERKKEIKEKYGKDSIEYSNVKIFLNGGYGVLAQRRPVESKYTNYVYASYITAYCRWRIMELAKRIEDGGDQVLSINTDGIIVADRSGGTVARSLQPLVADSLGALEITRFEAVTLFESGVYVLEPTGTLDRPCRCGKRHREIVKKRGMPSLCVDTLRSCNETSVVFSHQRPVKLVQAIIQDKADWIGVFVPRDVELRPSRSARDGFDHVPDDLFVRPLREYFEFNAMLDYRHLKDQSLSSFEGIEER